MSNFAKKKVEGLGCPSVPTSMHFNNLKQEQFRIIREIQLL